MSVPAGPAPHAPPTILWDGQKRVAIHWPDTDRDGVLFAFGLNESARWRVLGRRRFRRGQAALIFSLVLPLPGSALRLMVRHDDGAAAVIGVRFDPGLRPGADDRPLPFPGEGAQLFGVSHTLEQAPDDGGAQLRVGPAFEPSQWRARAILLQIAAAATGPVVNPGDHGPADSEASHLVRLYDITGRQGWSHRAGGDDGWPDAILLLGAPGVALSVTVNGVVTGPHRELAVACAGGELEAVALDVALQEAAGSALIAVSGHAGALTRAVAAPDRAAHATPFSAYDPRVQAARADAARAFAQAPTPWADGLVPAPSASPFESAGWPEPLLAAADSLSLQQQALLIDWTLAEPVVGRLLAALRIAPDEPPQPETIAATRLALEPLIARDGPERLMALAARAADQHLRLSGQALAGDIGTHWTPLAQAVWVIRALGLGVDERTAPAPDTGALTAARALLDRFERAAGAVGLLAALDPGQDPLNGAARCRDPDAADVALLRPVFARIDEAVAALAEREPLPASVSAHLRTAGRALAARHLVTLVERRSGLGGNAGSSEQRLRQGALHRMRMALPEGLSSYVVLAGGADQAALEEPLRHAWNLGAEVSAGAEDTVWPR